MVQRLSRSAAVGRGSPRSARSGRRPGERGSQTLEFALIVPGIAVLVVVLVHVAMLGADLLGVQVLAREGARAAARGADATAPVRAAADGRAVQVRISPLVTSPGEPVTVTVRLRSGVSDRLGFEVWLPGRVTMRREPGP